MKNVIGLSGVGRSGKDTFASILEIKLQQAGYSVKKVSFAGPLKLDCQAFLKDYLNMAMLNAEELRGSIGQILRAER
jgi:thymidylate kinase